MTLHRHAISKICALSLVALILTPFTAPFKTFDLASAQSDYSYGGLPKDKVDSDETLAGAPDESLAPPALNVVIVKPSPSPNQIQEHQLHYTILRV